IAIRVAVAIGIAVRVVACRRSRRHQSTTAQGREAKKRGRHGCTADQLVNGCNLDKLEVCKTWAVLTQPERPVIILENQLTMKAVLDLIEILDTDNLAIVKTHDQVRAIALERGNVAGMIIQLHYTWSV